MVMVGCCSAPKHSLLLLRCPSPPPISFSSTVEKKERIISFSGKRRTRSLVRFVASLGGGDSSSLLPAAAVEAAALRFQETHRPDPLFIDPYAGCFLSSSDEQCSIPATTPATASLSSSHYNLATRFIDDQVLDVMSRNDELRQVVLLTDGMDTRPYRLRWPRSTLIFDISPGRVFKLASQKLEGIGAKVAKTSLLLHVPFESSNLQELLCQKGFSGCRPSIWVLQGLPFMTLNDFKETLSIVSSLAMIGCIFMGELPCWLVETEFRSKAIVQKWMDKTFMGSGFRVDMVDYSEIATNVQCCPPSGDYSKVLFVAQQLQLSDGQMEKWRMEFQRIDEEGDEEGFDDMLV